MGSGDWMKDFLPLALFFFFFFFIYSTAGACWGGSCWVGPEGDGQHRERANHGSRRRDYK